MSAPNIARGKNYKGPRGVSNPSVLLDRETFNRMCERRRAAPRVDGDSTDTLLKGTVSLTPKSQRPEVVEPLRPACGEGDAVPRAASDLMWLAHKWGLRHDAWIQRVRPVSARGRLMAYVQTVVWVRVWAPWPDYGWVRAWRRVDGREKWEPLTTMVIRPWRKHGWWEPIRAAEVNKMIKGDA